MVNKNWSYKTGQNNSKTKEYSHVDITLFNRLKTSKIYKHIASELDLNIFIESSYEVTIEKRKNMKRFLNFIWYDLLGEQVEIRVEVNEETHIEFRILQNEILLNQRQSTNIPYSDSTYRTRNDPNASLHARI